MELLKKVGDHESFVFHNEQINHIEDLVAVLKDATDEEYSTYASEDKNDFANWVEHVLNNKDVADKLRNSASKDDTVSLLDAEISSRTQESVLESKESIMAQAPVERPEEMKIETPSEPSSFSEPAEPASFPSSVEPAPIVNEPVVAPVVEEPVVAPVEPVVAPAEPVAAPVVEEQTISAPEISEPAVSAPVEEPTPIAETIAESEPAEPITTEAEKPAESASAKTSSESIIPKNVVTPITQEDPNKLTSNAEPHHFCGVHMDCMKREFVFGLLIGLLIGIVGLQMIHAVL